MKTLNTASWDATVELDNRISLLISILSEKYGVRVNVDSAYDKGTIRIKIID